MLQANKKQQAISFPTRRSQKAGQVPPNSLKHIKQDQKTRIKSQLVKVN